MVQSQTRNLLVVVVTSLLLAQGYTVAASDIQYNVSDGEYIWDFVYREYIGGVSSINFTGTISVDVISATNSSVKGTIDPSPTTLDTTISNAYVSLFRSDGNHDNSSTRDLSVIYHEFIALPDFLPVDYKASFVFPVSDGYWDNLPSTLENLGTSDGSYAVKQIETGGNDYYNVSGERDGLPYDGCKCSFEYIVQKDTGIIQSYTRSAILGLNPVSFEVEMTLQDNGISLQLPVVSIPIVALLLFALTITLRKVRH